MIALNPNAGPVDPYIASDLRRKQPRALAEWLVERSEALARDERELVRAIYHDGLSATRVAQIRDEDPRRVAKCVRRCVRRMLSPEFEYVYARLDRWPTTKRQVAKACILQGRSMRATARHLQLSLHVVTRIVRDIRAAANGGAS